MGEKSSPMFAPQSYGNFGPKDLKAVFVLQRLGVRQKHGETFDYTYSRNGSSLCTVPYFKSWTTKTILNVPTHPPDVPNKITVGPCTKVSVASLSLCALFPLTSLNELCKNSDLVTLRWAKPVCRVTACDNSDIAWGSLLSVLYKIILNVRKAWKYIVNNTILYQLFDIRILLQNELTEILLYSVLSTYCIHCVQDDHNFHTLGGRLRHSDPVFSWCLYTGYPYCCPIQTVAGFS